MKLNVFNPSVILRSSRRLSLTLFMLSIVPVASLVCAPATAQPVTIEPVVLSTDVVPGGGATFGGLGAPSINAHGAIAFPACGDGSACVIYTTAHGSVVGPLMRAVGPGDVPPG